MSVIDREPRRGLAEVRSRSLSLTSGRTLRAYVRNPWCRPRLIRIVAWSYLVFALVPVIMAILFSFNDGRSRSVFDGLSMRWWTGDETFALFHNPAMLDAIAQSLKLAAVDVAVATPLGVLLAVGLSRWRGRGSRAANLLMLAPLVTPELTAAVGLFLVFTQVAIPPFTVIHFGTATQVVGQVTLALPFVVVVVRGRLASIGRQYEEAAQDLGATPLQSLRLVLVPMLSPAIVASALLVFVLSIDNFVVTQYMAGGPTTTTVPMYIYATARGSAVTPALNALATVMTLSTLLPALAALGIHRWWGRRNRRRSERRGQLTAELEER